MRERSRLIRDCSYFRGEREANRNKIYLKINSQMRIASWKARDGFISFPNTHTMQTVR